jgi:tRNA-specific 2-thiouridylase
VLVAMSGGVDSSVAASILQRAGHDLIGVTLKQWQGPEGGMPTSGCCTALDAEDARRVAAQLDIPYYVLDYTASFRAAVVERFASAYGAGRTPNPCVDCNREVRFGALAHRAAELGCDAIATGHHARVRRAADGFHLLRGRDRDKDQSYVLFMLGQLDLASVQLPIGELTKGEVRSEAERLGLRTAAKPDSQDICFVDGDYREFLRRHFPGSVEPGDVVDDSGKVVGRHDGTAGFTIGQRRGIGVAAAEPRYVIDIDAPARTIVVGPRHRLRISGVRISDVTWVSGRPPGSPAVEIQVRYRSSPAPALIEGTGGEWTAWFDGEAAAPGQAAVLYSGDEVLGGGTIAGVIRRD